MATHCSVIRCALSGLRVPDIPFNETDLGLTLPKRWEGEEERDRETEVGESVRA
jgi:hypothetical protein